jgi:hypothetical protein
VNREALNREAVNREAVNREAMNREAVNPHEAPRDETMITKCRRQPKTSTHLPNHQEDREEVTEPFTRNIRLCTPFKVFLEKETMGQLHQIPKQHRALEVPDPDVVVGLDPGMHVWDIVQNEEDHSTLYKVGLITGFPDDNNAEVTFYKSTYQRYGMGEDAPSKSEWARAVQAKEEIPISQLAVLFVGAHEDRNCFL